MDKLLRLPQVKEATLRSTTRIYQDMTEGTFPKPIKIGPRAVAWRESDIDEWIKTRETAVINCWK